MKDYLKQFQFPEDLKEMDYDELELLSYEIRDFLIEKVSKTGGHLSSNLGAVELTIALHRCFDTPKDKIIWDVGHQTYVHKILTGRADGFDSLRKYGGMSGFPKQRDSEYRSQQHIPFTGAGACCCAGSFGRGLRGSVRHRRRCHDRRTCF